MKFTKLKACIAASILAALGFTAFAASPIQLGGSIFPLVFINQAANNSVDEFNQLLVLMNAQLQGISAQYPGTGLEPPLGEDTSQTVFSSASLQQSPIMLQKYQNMPIGAVNSASANDILIQGAPGRTIYPDGYGITVGALGGNLATCTSVSVLCSPSTAAIGTWNVAVLTSGRPVSLSSATTVGYGAQSCVAGDSVVVTQAGSGCATATGIAFTIPYTVQ